MKTDASHKDPFLVRSNMMYERVLQANNNRKHTRERFDRNYPLATAKQGRRRLNCDRYTVGRFAPDEPIAHNIPPHSHSYQIYGSYSQIKQSYHPIHEATSPTDVLKSDPVEPQSEIKEYICKNNLQIQDERIERLEQAQNEQRVQIERLQASIGLIIQRLERMGVKIDEEKYICEPEDGKLSFPLCLSESLSCLSMVESEKEAEGLKEFKDMEVEEIFSEKSPINPVSIDSWPNKSVEQIAISEIKDFDLGKEIIFDEFTHDGKFSVKTTKIEFLAYQEKIIKFMWTMDGMEVVGFEIFIQVLGLYAVSRIHNQMLKFHCKHHSYKIRGRIIAAFSCGSYVKLLRGTRGRVLFKWGSLMWNRIPEFFILLIYISFRILDRLFSNGSSVIFIYFSRVIIIVDLIGEEHEKRKRKLVEG